MDLIGREDLKKLLAEPGKPCVSLFMPTHRGGGEADRIRWRVHVGEAEKQLIGTGLRAPDVRELLGPARQLLEDPLFWKHQCDGLAAFLAPRVFHIYRLPMTFEDLVVTADHFQVTPLLPLLTSNGRYYVLALSQEAVRLLQGSRYSVSKVDLRGVPRNLAEASLTHDSSRPFTFFGRRQGGPESWGRIFHGHGVGLNDTKEELLQYFHKIDRGLYPLLSEEKAPLVLAGAEYLLPIYRRANSYPHLLEQAIEGNPDRLSNQELHDRAWALVRPHFEEAQHQAAAQYRQLAGTGRTASELNQVVSAAYHGQVETLLVALGRQSWGRFDPATGQLHQHEQTEPGDEDLLNLAAVHTLLRRGAVFMPWSQTRSPAAGRWPPSFASPCPSGGAGLEPRGTSFTEMIRT
jgi:hypothetical protein